MNQEFPLNWARIRFTADGRAERYIPVGDIILQTELHVATAQEVHAFKCPCTNCHGSRRKTINVIRRHHAEVGKDLFLMHSMIGGDPPNGYPPRGLWVPDIAYDDDVVEEDPLRTPNAEDTVAHNETLPEIESEPATDGPLDEYHEVQRQVMEALDRGDALHMEVGEGLDVVDDNEIGNDTVDGLEDLHDQATAPLYSGSKTSVVSATIVLMNMCTVFRVSNRFADELL